MGYCDTAYGSGLIFHCRRSEQIPLDGVGAVQAVFPASSFRLFAQPQLLHNLEANASETNRVSLGREVLGPLNDSDSMTISRKEPRENETANAGSNDDD